MTPESISNTPNARAVLVARCLCAFIGVVTLGAGAALWVQDPNIGVSSLYVLLCCVLGAGFVLVGILRPPHAVIGLLTRYVESVDD